MHGLESTLQTLNSWMSGASETLAIILNQGVYTEGAQHEWLSSQGIEDKAWSGVHFSVSLLGGVEGEFLLLLDRNDASTLIDLLVGGSGSDGTEDMTPLHESVLQESMQQLVAGLSDQLTAIKGATVKVRLSRAGTQLQLSGIVDEYLWWRCPLTLDEGPGFGITVLCPQSFVKQFAAPADLPVPPKTGSKSFLSQFSPLEDEEENEASGAEKPHFSELKQAGATRRNGQFDLILDVPLQVQVVLGRTSLMVQELIHLGEGSILELDKLAGEPVELYVQDRLVAYAEVIVVDERFGVKVLELVSGRRHLRPVLSA